MFNPRVPCACCYLIVDREPKQKKTHYFIGCGCPVTPLVCSHCRHRSTNCMWCQKSGYSTSLNFVSHSYDINSAAIDWVFVQRRYSNVSIPYIMQIRLNWLNYHKFLKIKFYEYENIFFFFGNHRHHTYNKDFAISFFSSFMQAQIFHITGAQRISKKYEISQNLFWLVKNITVARMLICNLFGESKNTRFFTGRRNIVKSNNDMMSIVLHRLLSNFALLIL